jgi:hypothetical protein
LEEDVEPTDINIMATPRRRTVLVDADMAVVLFGSVMLGFECLLPSFVEQFPYNGEG